VSARCLSWICIGTLVSLPITLLADTKGGEAWWPQWRGPNRTGLSTETNLLKKWPAGGPPLVWKATGAGEGYSSVTLADGRLFTMGNRGDAEFVLCYDVKTGKELWAVRNGLAFKNDRGNGPRSSVTIDGQWLYALGASGDLSCLAAADGKVRWHLNILQVFNAKPNVWGISESPLVEGDIVICNPGGPGASIVALDKTTGRTIWKTTELSDKAGYSSAVPLTVEGVRQIVHFTDATAVGVRISDGKLLWRYQKASNKTANIATPIVHDGYAFVSSAYGTGGALLKLIPNGSETKAEEVYFTRDMQNHHGGVLLVDGYLYGFSNNIFTCLDFKTGKRMWHDRSVGKGCLTCADGHFYVVSEDGVVGLVQATPDAYKEASRFEIHRGKWPTWPHPVIAGGRLYIRNQDEILCYDVAAR
jgi:outer membrane protein assembly factor BamB